MILESLQGRSTQRRLRPPTHGLDPGLLGCNTHRRGARWKSCHPVSKASSAWDRTTASTFTLWNRRSRICEEKRETPCLRSSRAQAHRTRSKRPGGGRKPGHLDHHSLDLLDKALKGASQPGHRGCEPPTSARASPWRGNSLSSWRREALTSVAWRRAESPSAGLEGATDMVRVVGKA